MNRGTRIFKLLQTSYYLAKINQSITSTAKKIGIGVAIVLGSIIGYLVLNLYALNGLYFSDLQLGGIDLANTSAEIKIKVNNPTLIPASFEKMQLVIDYKSTNFGTVTIHGATISPLSEKNLDGNLRINVQALAALVLESLFGGGSSFDESQLRIVASVDAPIFGVIPYSITKEYSKTEFQELLADLTKRGEKEILEFNIKK